MLGFNQFLTEAKSDGASTARQGHANEIFSNDFFNHYAKHYDEANKSGKTEEQAHAHATKAVRNLKYDHDYHRNRTDLEPKTAAQIKKSVEELGPENSEAVFHSSKNSFEAPVEYLRKRYPGVKLMGAIHAGAGQSEGNADNVLKLQHEGKNKTSELHQEHVGPLDMTKYGLSQKYSRSLKDEDTKIHSPGVNKLVQIINDHHSQMFGKESDISEDLSKAVKAGKEGQRNSVLETNSKGVAHHQVLSDLLQKLTDDADHSKATGRPMKYLPPGTKADEWAKKIKNAKYEPSVHPVTGELNGADFNDHFLSILRNYGRENEKFKGKKLSSRTKGIDHDGIDEAYTSIAGANSRMKGSIADAINKPLSKMLGHTSASSEEQSRIDGLKHSLHRSLLNIHEPSENTLPTMLVKTLGDGTTHIADANEAFEKHFGEKGAPNQDNLSYTKKTEGKGSFRVGPATLTVDSRPGTMHNPLTNPVNFTLPGKFFKPAGNTYSDGKFEKEITSAPTNKKVSKKTKVSSAPVAAVSGSKPKPTEPTVSGGFGQFRGDGPSINPDVEHGGRQFYAPHEKALMKGL